MEVIRSGRDVPDEKLKIKIKKTKDRSWLKTFTEHARKSVTGESGSWGRWHKKIKAS